MLMIIAGSTSGDRPCFVPDPWDDLWTWHDPCIWLDDGAELVLDGGVPVFDGTGIVLDKTGD